MNSDLEQNINYLNNYSAIDNTEGGLNVSEIINIILRKLPLILGCTVTMTALALLKILITPPQYVAGFELLSEPVNIATKLTSADNDSRETREEITTVELDEVQLKILRSPRLILRIVKSLKDKYPGLNYQELIEGLTIEIIPSSQEEQNILKVEYRNEDQEMVADVVSALNKIYRDYSVEKRQSGVKRGIAFLDRQIPQVSDRAEKLGVAITELKTQHNFNNPDTSLNEITSRINQLSQRREENTILLKELQLTLNNLEQELEEGPARSTTAIELATPRYLGLLGKLREIDLKINQKSTVFSEQSEILQPLNQEKEQLNSLIVQEGANIRRKLNNRISILNNRQQSIAAEINDLKSQLKQWSAISNNYKNLQHELNKANSKLNGFTSQKDALQIDVAQQESPWQLLTPATEPTTDSINKINYLLLGSTLGLIIGIGIAFILDKQQKIIYSSVKIEELTNLPILATIPYIARSKEASLFQQISPVRQRLFSSSQSQLERLEDRSLPQFSIHYSIEAFRSFAANLGFFNFIGNNPENFNLDTSLKSIVITSAIPREGKSLVALNLAKASASMGKKVLLVDTDLRSTDCLTKNLGLESEIGLRNILNDEEPISKLNCIRQIPLEENLFILTSGYEDLKMSSSQQDSSRLLASSQMRSIMEELRTHFDLIIYDLCAIIGFADVNLLANKTDGIVMVTGLGKIQAMALSEAMSQLKLCQAPILGIAVNKVVNNA